MQLSDWQEGVPELPGFYQIKYHSIVQYSYWDGTFWSWFYDTIDQVKTKHKLKHNLDFKPNWKGVIEE